MRSVRATLGLILLIVAGPGLARADEAAVWSDQTIAAESLLMQLHAGGTFNGMLLVDADGRAPLRFAIGLPASSEPPEQLLFRYASVTKQVTAVLTLMAVDEGLVGLDQPVLELLPDLPPTFFAGVTIRHLLQHSSGLPQPLSTAQSPRGEPFYRRLALKDGHAALVRSDCSGIPGQARKAAAGTTYAYNNCDYFVLGAVLEAVHGTPFGNILNQRIAQPLGLTSWRVYNPLTSSRTPRGDDADTLQGETRPGEREAAYQLGSYGAAGGLYGNGADLLTWLRQLRTTSLLSPRSRGEMLTGIDRFDAHGFGAWSYMTAFPGVNRPVSVIERQGKIGGIQVVTLILPSEKMRILLVSALESTPLGHVTKADGLLYELVSALLSEQGASARSGP